MDISAYKPNCKLNNKHLLTLRDYSKEEIFEILCLAKEIKDEYKSGAQRNTLKNKVLAMIFAKSSTRTRLSFEMGMHQLGGSSIFLSALDIQMGRSENIADTARVISRMGISGLMIRTYNHSDVEDFARMGSIPVINGLTDDYHPCQALADVMTAWEKKGHIKGLKMVFMGDGNNVTHSLMVISAKLGIDFTAICPKDYSPSKEVYDYCQSIGGKVKVTDQIKSSLAGADVVYTDVVFSMGQPKSKEKAFALLPYQVNDTIMDMAGPGALFMHCMPAHREEEVTASVIDGPQSVVLDEAENRLHVQKAVLELLLRDY
ncbi:MAG: ornithine carbamoyltransferase [Christensenellales bacterium]|jgi:ornithine carbamoyltransferase